MPGFLGPRPQFKSKYNRKKRAGGTAHHPKTSDGGGDDKVALAPEMVLKMEELHRKVNR